MPVLLCGEIDLEQLIRLLDRYHLQVIMTEDEADIPGSFWQPPEAGLVDNRLYIRNDTPVHSALHEACHYICMDSDRRNALDTDAGGDFQEEDAVCYLQILLADSVNELKQARMFSDMDEWGYSFRLGSAQAWFENDAEDALNWLHRNRLVNTDNEVTFQLRTSPD